MFNDLLKLVDLFRKAAGGIIRFRESAEREAATLEMLKTYFLLLDAYEDGKRLLEAATDDPVGYIESLDGKKLEAQLNIWDKLLRRQAYRLYEAQRYLSTQSYLAVLDPDAQKKATEVIGYKMDRVATLHRLGAGLFFRTVFPSNETPKDTAQLVVETLTLEETGAVDRVAVSKELERLKEGLEAFRETIVQSIDQDEVRKLSEEARHATQLPPIRA